MEVSGLERMDSIAPHSVGLTQCPRGRASDHLVTWCELKEEIQSGRKEGEVQEGCVINSRADGTG